MQQALPHTTQQAVLITCLQGLACDSSLLRPLAASQIHQIQLAVGGPFLPFSQHAHLDMDGEDRVGS